MEDVLDVYQRVYDPLCPVICLDETNKQLLEERRIPVRPGNPELVDIHDSHCEKIILVMDNLNIHSIASLYKAFPLQEARRIASRLEIHYTPIHASWLNLAEIEIGILSRQCLSQSIVTFEEMVGQVAASAKYICIYRYLEI